MQMQNPENQNRSLALWMPMVAIALILAILFLIGKQLQAPDVTFTTIEGKTIRLTDMRGKMVLINFWATSCSVCREEMPALMDTYQEYHPKGLEVIAVAMSYDAPSHVVHYTETYRLPFPVMHDGFDEISRQFGDVRQTPTTYLLDQEGRIIDRIVGIIDFKALHHQLDARLGSVQKVKVNT